MDATDLFSFKDYRRFLKNWLSEAKIAKTCNLTELAASVGVHPTFLSQVLIGRKDLNLDQAALISKRVGLTKLERDYFYALIQLDRSGNSEIKTYWLERLSELEDRKNKLSERLEQHQELSLEQKARFYSSWLFSAVRLSTDINGGQTLNHISNRFRLAPERAEEILSFLTDAKLCEFSKGRYHLGANHIHVPNESPLVTKHHVNWRSRAISRMDYREKDELFLTAPMVISENDFAAVREKLNVAIKDIVRTAKASKSEKLACLNIDFFRECDRGSAAF